MIYKKNNLSHLPAHFYKKLQRGKASWMDEERLLNREE